jgi:hypothetical protein
VIPTRLTLTLTLALALLPLASTLPALAGAPGSDPPSELLDGSADRTLRTALVPSERNVHGEVRLIRRGEAWVLQTLIDSPQLRRGVQRMRKKELWAWPASEPGHQDSERYLEGLEIARDRVLEDFEARSDRSARAQQMLIELVLAPRSALWAFYEVETERSGDRWTLLGRRPIVVREADRSYLRRAFLLQAEEGFDGGAPELTELPP